MLFRRFIVDGAHVIFCALVVGSRQIKAFTGTENNMGGQGVKTHKYEGNRSLVIAPQYPSTDSVTSLRSALFYPPYRSVSYTAAPVLGFYELVLKIRVQLRSNKLN